MATKEFIIRPGEDLPDNIEAAFVQLFGSELTTKAKQSGGKFRVVFTSPWPKLPKVKREKRVIDQQFVALLKALAEEDTQLENEITKLSSPEILKVASILDVPMSKSSKLSSLRAQLHKTLRSEIIWNGIAGNRPRTLASNVLESARILEEPEKKRGKPVENPQINE